MSKLQREIVPATQQFPALPDGQYVFVWTWDGKPWAETVLIQDGNPMMYNGHEDEYNEYPCIVGPIVPDSQRRGDLHIYSVA